MPRAVVIALFASVVALAAQGSARAQDAPESVWQAATPSGLANSILGVAWSPTEERVLVGSTDRWVRSRRASSGALLYSALEPHRSGGVAQVVFSIDGQIFGVINRSATLTIRVHRSSDGAALGTIATVVGDNGIVGFVPDAALSASSPDGTLSRWRANDLTFFRTTGSGYDRVTTTFDFSPDGRYQTAASQGTIAVQRRNDGGVVATIAGGVPVRFSPDGALLAVSRSTPNEIVLVRTNDWTAVQTLRTPRGEEGIAALRFSPDGARLVSTGYYPYLDGDGLWQQTGVIRFWRVADGAVLQTIDRSTSLAVTSPIAWSPDGSRYAFGMYDGSVAVARTPE